MTGVYSGVESTAEAKAREGLYLLASRVFVKEVDPPFLQALADEQLVGALPSELRDSLEGRDAKEVIEELAVDYASCFLSSGAFLSLYESVQTSAEGQLNGQSADQALLFYKKSGFVVPEGCSLFADHFGIELEFMGHLCGVEASSFERGEEDGAKQAKSLQAEFMAAHIARWYRPFLQKVERATETSFYREMASFITGFLDSEREYLTDESDGLLSR